MDYFQPFGAAQGQQARYVRREVGEVRPATRRPEALLNIDDKKSEL
jgi:hypothetical protein